MVRRSVSCIFLLFCISFVTLGNRVQAGELNSDFHSEVCQYLWRSVSDEDPAGLMDALYKGCDVNVRDPETGDTPVMYTIRNDKRMSSYLLMDKGADPTIPDKEGYNIIHVAAFLGNDSLLDMTLDFESAEDMDLNEYHSDGYVPMHRSCWGEETWHTQMVKYFLEQDVPHDVPVHKHAMKHPGKTCKDFTKNPDTIKLLEDWVRDNPNSGIDMWDEL